MFQFGRMEYLKTRGFDVSDLCQGIKGRTLAFLAFESVAEEFVDVGYAAGFGIINHADVRRPLVVFV
jgi:hypothetical protein